MRKAYAVRQKSTGLFIPVLKRGSRNGTALEPSNDREPRLFHNKNSANGFLSNWCQGLMHCASDNHPEWPETYIDVIKQPHRNKADMEIVEFDLIEVIK